MAWYRDGTVRVTNGSATVTGNGTLWGDNKQGIGPGQMLLVPAAGTVQVYEILRIDSNTQLTLKDNFVGATAGASVYAIPSFYTDSVPDFARRLSAQLSYYQSQMDGWQQIMTGNGSVTLTAPNGQAVTISSFKKLTDDMDGKASNSDPRLNTINGKTGGAISSNVSIDGTLLDLRSNTPTGGWPFLIRFMAGQGNNIPYVQLNQANSGDFIVGAGLSGTPRYYIFGGNGNLQVPGNITCTSLTQTSDKDKKDEITTIPDALEKINAIRGVTFIWKETGLPSAGVIAQELKDVLPESIGAAFDDHDEYGEVDQEVEHQVVGKNGEIETVKEIVKTQKIVRKRDDSKRSYSVEYSGVIALAVQAINELSEKVRSLEAEVGSLKSQQTS